MELNNLERRLTRKIEPFVGLRKFKRQKFSKKWDRKPKWNFLWCPFAYCGTILEKYQHRKCLGNNPFWKTSIISKMQIPKTLMHPSRFSRRQITNSFTLLSFPGSVYWIKCTPTIFFALWSNLFWWKRTEYQTYWKNWIFQKRRGL